MKKILLIGPHEKKKELLRLLQDAGVAEIKPHKSEQSRIEINRSKADHILDTYNFLREYKTASDELINTGSKKVDLDCKITCNTLQDYKKQLFNLKNEELNIRNNIEKALIWGRFDLSLIREISDRGKTSIQFWETSLRTQFDDCQIPNEIIVEEIFQNEERKYFITFFFMPIKLEHCEEVIFEEDLFMLEKDLQANLDKQVEMEEVVINYVPMMDSIYDVYINELDNIAYEEAHNSTGEFLEGRLFFLQGWCPEKDMPDLTKRMEESLVEIMEIKPDEDEKVPTKMVNGKLGEMGSDLVNMYDTPSYKDWDPSSWVFFSFAIFFAMIMADGGYGVILLILIGFAKVKLKTPAPAMERFLNMSLILSGATVLYGLASGGFLGLSNENRLFGWLVGSRLFDPLDIDMMMNASIVIGMIHVSISLFLKALRLIKVFGDNITPMSNIAWIVAIWSFYFWYGYGRLDSHPLYVYESTILTIFVISLTVVFFTTAGTFQPSKLIFGGLGGLYNGVQFFSDILSYLRLFALGMAGTLLAQTFNNLAADVIQIGFPGIILGVIIFLLGHIINLLLCVMGGVIHGLRLNFLEWYRWSFDGDGKVFKPFRLLAKMPRKTIVEL